MKILKILPFLFLILILTSCSFSGKQDMGETPTTITGGSNLNVQKEAMGTARELTIKEKEDLLISEDELTSSLKSQKKSGPFYEELPRIKSYYSRNPFYEYFLLLSVKENDKMICEKITTKESVLCKELFDARLNRDAFIQIYSKYGEDKDFATDMFNTYLSVAGQTECRGMKKIMLYLGCKKTLNKAFDADVYYYKYMLLGKSNLDIVKKYYKDYIRGWNLDEDFIALIESSLITDNELIK